MLDFVIGFWPIGRLFEVYVRIKLRQVRDGFGFFSDALDCCEVIVNVFKGVSINVGSDEVLKCFVNVQQFDGRIAEVVEFFPIEHGANEAPLVLRGVEPVDGFLAIAVIVKANGGDVEFGEFQVRPRLAHLRDGAEELRFVLGSQSLLYSPASMTGPAEL